MLLSRPETLPLHFPWFDKWDFEHPENTAAQIEELRQQVGDNVDKTIAQSVQVR